MNPPLVNSPLALGIDFGTSGARAAVINPSDRVLAEARCAYSATAPEQLAAGWRQALFDLLRQIPANLRAEVGAIAIDGTSSTVLLCDAQGQVVAAPLLYNDSRGRSQLDYVQQIAPANHTVISATSSLVKLLWWQENLPSGLWTQARFLLHQADWLAFLLHGKLGFSDYHNALKLGYDAGNLEYPDWLRATELARLLPAVQEPGSAIAPLQNAIASQFGFSPHCQICAGTTDSIAAFLASGAAQPGDGVTSLGSTLVLKLLSDTRVDDSRYGIYSHRLGHQWLVGGASNTGGAVLNQFFTAAELTEYSRQIDPTWPSPLDYYPLTKPGERFPINDPDLPPRLEPQPEQPIDFLHGLLESMARIEQQGYSLLQTLGASPLKQVFTAGGGAANPTWSQIRQRHLQRPIQTAQHLEAAVGAARLALSHLQLTNSRRSGA